MDKEIQKAILSATIRIVAILLSWGSTLTAFLWVHKGTPIIDNDWPFLIVSVMNVIITCVAMAGDGAREFD